MTEVQTCALPISAAIVEYASTTILFEGDRLEVLPSGELMIHIAQGE